MSNAFRTKLREALGLPLDIEEEGGATGGTASGGSTSGGGDGTGGTNVTGSGDTGSQGETSTGDTDSSINDDNPDKPHNPFWGYGGIGAIFKRGIGSDRCPDGKHRDPKTGQCKKK